MKSLLVDALRQASGNAPPDPEPAHVPQPGQPGPDVAEARPDQATVAKPAPAENRDELELIESAVMPAQPVIDVAVDADVAGPDHAEQAAEETGKEPGTRLAAHDEPVDQPPALIETDVIEPAVILPALDIEKAAARAQSGTAATTPRIRPRRDPMLVLARWSPALCLLAMTAAAGTLAFYQKTTATSMNVDLGGLPTQTGSDAVDSRSTPAWQRLATTEDAARLPVPGEMTPPDRSAANPGTREAAKSAQPPAALRAPLKSADDLYFAAVLSAHDAYERGDFANAEREYRAVLDANPNHSDALSGLAAILQRSGRTEEALTIYSRLIAVNPDDTSAAASLAAYAQYDSATDPATRVKVMLQKKPAAAALHFALGLIMAEPQQRWPEAYDAFLEASRLTPDNADYSYNVAISAQHLGQLDSAQRHYSSALQKVDDTSLVDRQAILAQLDRVSNSSEGELR